MNLKELIEKALTEDGFDEDGRKEIMAVISPVVAEAAASFRNHYCPKVWDKRTLSRKPVDCKDCRVENAQGRDCPIKKVFGGGVNKE